MRTYEDINIGDIEQIIHKITLKDIENFVMLTGDDNKLHVDTEFAQRTSFKKPVAHGMLSASFISTIIGTKLPGDGALWFSQTLEFLLPVRVNDVITVTAEVISKIDALNAIELKTEIYNQDKQKVISGKAKVKVVPIEEKKQDLQNNNLVSTPNVALIVGATGGIGSEVCKKIASLGYSIAIHYHSNELKANSLQEDLKKNYKTKSLKVNFDLLNQQEVETTISLIERRLGEIQLVVNCSTIKISTMKFESLTWDEMQKHFDNNIKSNFNLVKGLLPKMKLRKKGNFIFITTQYTEGTPPSDFMSYVVSKAALNGLAKSLAVEAANFNIRVNLVSPGITDTDLIADMPEKNKLLAAAKTPLKRLAKPEDVANAIKFLASEESSFMTGETLRINGGQIMI